MDSKTSIRVSIFKFLDLWFNYDRINPPYTLVSLSAFSLPIPPNQRPHNGGPPPSYPQPLLSSHLLPQIFFAITSTLAVHLVFLIHYGVQKVPGSWGISSVVDQLVLLHFASCLFLYKPDAEGIITFIAYSELRTLSLFCLSGSPISPTPITDTHNQPLRSSIFNFSNFSIQSVWYLPACVV